MQYGIDGSVKCEELFTTKPIYTAEKSWTIPEVYVGTKCMHNLLVFRDIDPLFRYILIFIESSGDYVLL